MTIGRHQADDFAITVKPATFDCPVHRLLRLRPGVNVMGFADEILVRQIGIGKMLAHRVFTVVFPHPAGRPTEMVSGHRHIAGVEAVGSFRQLLERICRVKPRKQDQNRFIRRQPPLVRTETVDERHMTAEVITFLQHPTDFGQKLVGRLGAHLLGIGTIRAEQTHKPSQFLLAVGVN